MAKLKTKFMLSDTRVNIIKVNEDNLTDKLPAQVYALQYNDFTGFYLDIIKDQLAVPEKIYGNVHLRADKCLNTYRTRKLSTGILMTGDKGTGKTLLMSVLANRVVSELGLPVILIREAYQGEPFSSFIEMVGECCLVFDEFGKTYRQRNREDDGAKQTALLSLLDGVDKTKRLIIMTENNKYDISEFMLNRPSRIFYHFEYKKLEEESIIDYCKDHELPADRIEDIAELARASRIFSFDMLQTIVEEHLRYPDETISSIIKELNIDIEEEDIPEIEILRVVGQDGREYEVLGSPIINKPVLRRNSDVTVIDRELYQTYPELRSLSSGDMLPDEIIERIGADMNEQAHIDLNISKNEVKYEGKGKIVYETDYDIRVVARELPRARRFSYSELF